MIFTNKVKLRFVTITNIVENDIHAKSDCQLHISSVIGSHIQSISFNLNN